MAIQLEKLLEFGPHKIYMGISVNALKLLELPLRGGGAEAQASYRNRRKATWYWVVPCFVIIFALIELLLVASLFFLCVFKPVFSVRI